MQQVSGGRATATRHVGGGAVVCRLFVCARITDALTTAWFAGCSSRKDVVGGSKPEGAKGVELCRLDLGPS